MAETGAVTPQCQPAGMQSLRSFAGLCAALALAALPAHAADPVALNVVIIPTDSAAQAFYALDQGFFKAAGLDVHISTMNGSPAIIAAAVSGAVDIGNSMNFAVADDTPF